MTWCIADEEHLLDRFLTPIQVKASSKSTDNILWQVTTARSSNFVNEFGNLFNVFGKVFHLKSDRVIVVSVADEGNSYVELTNVALNNVLNYLLQGLLGAV